MYDRFYEGGGGFLPPPPPHPWAVPETFILNRVKDAAENKMFWKNFKSYCSDKGSNATKITPVEKDIIITDEKQAVNIMNEHFVIITKNLSSKPSISSKDSDSDFFS